MNMISNTPGLKRISNEWQDANLDLYLDRCQVDTPPELVKTVWEEVARRRDTVGSVVDFGAGDGRFARQGSFASYQGYEIDWDRCSPDALPANAEIVHRCAFAKEIKGRDLAIGNPPFVRNQDLPDGWRQKVADRLQARSGVRLSGLANAWQYFFLLSLLSVRDDGLCALVIPYEWVSRPSVAAMRDYILRNGWGVDVYRLQDSTFGGVLTTASITIIDKAVTTARWRYFDHDGEGAWRALESPTGSTQSHLPYRRAVAAEAGTVPHATRGLSPGSQRVFTLTEGERARLGLRVDDDVVPCVTSLRHIPAHLDTLDAEAFNLYYRHKGHRCWLLRTDRPLSSRLSAYLDSVSPNEYATSTCLNRPVWWKYKMPMVADVLVATCFKGSATKACRNVIGATAIGGVASVHRGASDPEALTRMIGGMDLGSKIVAHANELRKVEINQLNSILAGLA